MDQAKRLKSLEKENGRLKKLVADLSVDNQILEEVSSGNFQARRSGDEPWYGSESGSGLPRVGTGQNHPAKSPIDSQGRGTTGDPDGGTGQSVWPIRVPEDHGDASP